MTRPRLRDALELLFDVVRLDGVRQLEDHFPDETPEGSSALMSHGLSGLVGLEDDDDNEEERLEDNWADDVQLFLLLLLVLSFLLGPLSTFSGLMEKPMRHIRPSSKRNAAWFGPTVMLFTGRFLRGKTPEAHGAGCLYSFSDNSLNLSFS